MSIEPPSHPEFCSGQTSHNLAKNHHSSIAFPHLTLKEAVAVARTIFDNVGTGTCSNEQIARWLGRSPRSSEFRSRLAAMRIFGLVNDRRYDAIFLTKIGCLALDQARGREGRVRAFMNVPLFAVVYEKFKGRPLPAPDVLERGLIALGVVDRMKAVARHMLEQSAAEAGFYDCEAGHLVMPSFPPVPATSSEHMNGRAVHAHQGPASGLHPLIQGLLEELPDSGTTAGGIWPDEKRKLWFSAAESIFRVIYQAEPASQQSNRRQKR